MKTQHIIAAIQQTPRCSNIDKRKLLDFLKGIIGKTSLYIGGQMYENDIYFVREEVLKRIYKEYSFLHIGELQIIFKEGSAEKFGQVYSLTPLAINRWIVAYIDSDCRKKAIQEIHRISAERQLPAKASTVATTCSQRSAATQWLISTSASVSSTPTPSCSKQSSMHFSTTQNASLTYRKRCVSWTS